MPNICRSLLSGSDYETKINVSKSLCAELVNYTDNKSVQKRLCFFILCICLSSGGQVLEVLLSLDDVVGTENKKRRIYFEKKLDEILDYTGDFDILENYFDTNVRDDIDPPALKYFAGYVVRKAKRCSVAKECEECFNDLLAPATQDDTDDDLIEWRSHSYLFKPSDNFMDLVYRLETAVLSAQQNQNMSKNILFEVVGEVEKMGLPTHIGCSAHEREISKWLINFYLNTRMIFACKDHTKTAEVQRQKAKMLEKQSKLL